MSPSIMSRQDTSTELVVCGDYMRVYFEDRSYADIAKATSPKKYFVTVGARQGQEIIVNSAEVTLDQLEEMLSDIPISREPVKQAKPKPKTKTTKSDKAKSGTKKNTTRKKRATKTKAVEEVEEQTSTSDDKPASKPFDG